MAWWNRPSAELIAEKAVEKALSVVTAQGRVGLPAGTQTMTADQARQTQLSVGVQENPLPRNPMDSRVSFGPATPLLPRPIDPQGPWGRPEPRRTEYQIAWNLQLSNLRAVPWEVLRAAADQCDVVRRCIDIRKAGIQEQAWDIALTPEATARLMQQDDTIKSPQKAQMIGRTKYQPIIDRIREFLEEPDAQNGEDWSTWIGNVLEERYVWDALSIWPVFQTRRQYPRRRARGLPRARRFHDQAAVGRVWQPPRCAVSCVPADPVWLPAWGVRRRDRTRTASSPPISSSTPPPTCVRVGRGRMAARPLRRLCPLRRSGSNVRDGGGRNGSPVSSVGPMCSPTRRSRRRIVCSRKPCSTTR